MKRKIKGSVVVVTGASSGIGRATALRLAEQGARLVLVARRGEPLDDVVHACQDLGANAQSVVADVSDSEQVAHIVEAATSAYGRIDAWVNNAGVYAMGTVEQTPESVFERVMDVNYFGYVYATRAVLPVFRRQGGGTLVFVDSVAGRISGPYISAYSASKFAVRGFTEALRDELRGSGISVSVIYPPAVDTPLFEHSANFTGRAIKPENPVYPPEKIARAIVACLEKPEREVIIGAGKGFSFLHAAAPGLFDRIMTRQMERDHFKDEPATKSEGNLFAPMDAGTGAEGGWRRGSKLGKAAILVTPFLLPAGLRKLGYPKLAQRLEFWKPLVGAVRMQLQRT